MSTVTAAADARDRRLASLSARVEAIEGALARDRRRAEAEAARPNPDTVEGATADLPTVHSILPHRADILAGRVRYAPPPTAKEA